MTQSWLFMKKMNKEKPSCKTCIHCVFFAYEDEDEEYQVYYDCELEYYCFDYENGICDDYQRKENKT